MIICGIKVTHDSAVALLEDGKLIFSVELEKICNKKRHAKLDDPALIDFILNSFGYTRDNVDTWVVDGWHNVCVPNVSREGNYINFGSEEIRVNNYQNRLLNTSEHEVVYGVNMMIGEYASYTHTYTHLCSSYCTSPFSKTNESSYILLFDGGTKPVLYYYNGNEFIFCNEVLKFGGDIYADVSSRFEPYRNMRKVVAGKETFNLHFVGKVMAYIALGKKIPEIIDKCYEIYDSLSSDNSFDNDWEQNRIFAKEYEKFCRGVYRDEDSLASFHYFLQEILTNKLVEAVDGCENDCRTICFAGGNMLNIKWNSEIRNTGRFEKVYAPPFINDSGAAIGCVCAEWFRISKQAHIDWCTYGGMPVVGSSLLEGWSKCECTLKELAYIIASTGEPIVMLNGNAELGPRALGNRSILADPRRNDMKEILNKIKNRESYRPVAPICLEEDAPQYFYPGTSDKYMLFEHRVKCEDNVIPAIKHIDGTARLQTVAREDNVTIYELLTHFKNITGVPVLCNTSANFLGSGFFPDIVSVQKWGGCNYIWSDGIVYEKCEKIKFRD